jgi:2-polyprenyl-6-hydroxyphenyl methylase/3-demethylubiquinone-9 3-methyltransferase
LATSPVALTRVNNAIYEQLGERWYDAEDDPIALLRAESRLLAPWLASTVRAEFGPAARRVLDLGCGAGFLANYLGALGHEVTGLDASAAALQVAAEHDPRRSVRYVQGDALSLPFTAGSFDVVCAMDFLEHVESRERVIAEAARMLAPGGLFFFHTFNRNFLAYLVIIKGVEWFVRNTPPELHVLRLFSKPAEIRHVCAEHGFEIAELRGVRPKLGWPFWRMLLTGRVRRDFEFSFTRGTPLGFCGWARKSA